MTWQRVGRFLAHALVVGLFAAACSSGHEQPPPAPVTLAPAWQAVLAQIQPDGTVTATTALQAFALAFGPLPGVTAPPGGTGAVPSGSAALRWLVGRWREITSEQRKAAIALIPELKGLPPVSGGTAAGGPPPAIRSAGAQFAMGAPVAVAAQVAAGPQAPAEAVVRAVPRVWASPKRSDLFYTQLAQQVAKDIGARLGRSLSIPVEAKVGLPQDAKANADTGVYDSNGGITGTPAKCLITVGPLGDAYDGDDVGQMIAHEVFHCFEADIIGLARYWDPSRPAWIIEGEAQWVSASLYPNAPVQAAFWQDYLVAPQNSLFKRAYDAMGFYAQLTSSGTDAWSRLVPILLANGNAAAFVAAGADQDPFLDVWAAGYARDASRGTPWDITGPGVPGDKPTPAALQASDGVSVTVQAKSYSNAIYAVTDPAEVLIMSSTGHARVSDSSNHDYLVGDVGTFCHKVGGCACPDQEATAAPMLDLSGSDIVVALTGATAGAQGTVEGLSLKKYCERGPLSGTWSGAWWNDNGLAVGNGVVDLVQKGKALIGTAEVTGKTCVRHGTISGTVSGSTVHIVLTSVRVVTMDGTFNGKTMSGTWSAPSCGPPYGPKNVTVTVTGTWRATKVK